MFCKKKQVCKGMNVNMTEAVLTSVGYKTSRVLLEFIKLTKKLPCLRLISNDL